MNAPLIRVSLNRFATCKRGLSGGWGRPHPTSVGKTLTVCTLLTEKALSLILVDKGLLRVISQTNYLETVVAYNYPNI